MKKFRVKQTALMSLTAVALFIAAPASANEFINNDVTGAVQGTIHQEAAGHIAQREVAVGSIEAQGARDNTVKGYVGGNITQSAYSRGGPMPSPMLDDTSKVVQVGSIKAQRADRNDVRGYVGGEIYQAARVEGTHSPEREADVRVGAIDTEDRYGNAVGFAMDNNVEGHVDGDIIQTGVSGGMSTRVGVLTK